MLRRAGLDYWNELNVTFHKNLRSFLDYSEGGKLFLVSKFSRYTYSDIDYSDLNEDYYFIFGKETTGLPEKFMREYEENCIRIPMDDTHVRSLNLSNTVSIVAFEVLRQQNFHNLEKIHKYSNDKFK